MDATFTIALATGMSTMLLLLGGVAWWQRRQVPVERLHTFVEQMKRGGAEQEPEVVGLLADVDTWMTRQSFGADVARSLARADVKLTVTEYVLLHVAAAGFGLVVGPLLFGTALAGIGLGAVLLFAPRIYVGLLTKRRLDAFNAQLPNALGSLANALRGGYGLVQAMSLAATEMSPPISSEFQRVVSEVGFGLPYGQAFQNMLRRNPSEDLTLVVSAIEVHLELGGNLSEILENISAIVRDRVRIQGQVRALTALQRFQAIILSVMPFGLMAIIYITNPTYMSQLWTEPLGMAMLAAALTLLGVGMLLMRSLGKIEV